MKAIRVSRHGDPHVMRLEEVPVPQPGPGGALVKLAAIGVNYSDVYQRTGVRKTPFPFTPGREGAGIVAAIGPEVAEVAVGDRVVYASGPGSYADYVVVPASKLVKMPANVEFESAASVLLQGLTAHYLTHSTYPLKPGETCLVHAAAGGVGGLLVQMARRRGARVIGTVSTEEKARWAGAIGADDVVRYTEQDFEAAVKRITGGRGVQVVYDGVGRATFEKGLNCLAPRGYMVLFGQPSGPVAPIDPLVLQDKGGIFLTRSALDYYTATRDELLWRAGDVLGWLASGALKVHLAGRLPLAEAAEAHRRLESRQTVGKLLLIP